MTQPLSVQDMLDNSLAMIAAAERIDTAMGGVEWHRMLYADYAHFAEGGKRELLLALRGFTDHCRTYGLQMQADPRQ